MKRFTILCVALLILLIANPLLASQDNTAFNQYLNQIKQRALRDGVSKKTLEKYLSNIKPPKVIKKSIYIRRQKHQAAKVDTFKHYKKQFISKASLPYARAEYQRFLPLLKRIEKVYHVQPQIIVALWGIESDYGRYAGNFPLIRSLAILGFHHHRKKFYQRQLIDALIMLDRPKVIPQQLKSAWDGGMGQTQFEPAAYLSYGVDFNKDGFANIWTDPADVFASIANFLSKNGWNGQYSWGLAVKIPQHFRANQSGLPLKYPISHWKKLGVTQVDGKPLPNVPGKTTILLPDGIKGDAYLVYPNFKVLLRWNDIVFEGICVGLLSDRITEQQ